jgi:hypothetical protein
MFFMYNQYFQFSRWDLNHIIIMNLHIKDTRTLANEPILNNYLNIEFL